MSPLGARGSRRESASVSALAVVSGLFLSVGCASVGRRAVVPVDDYAEYRRFCFASGVEGKLARGFDYLYENPRGAYRSDVMKWFSPNEKLAVARAWESAPRLEAFLGAVPKGPYAERAAARLVELRLTEEYRARSERAFDERVAKIEGRLDAAEVGRRELLSGVVRWVKRLVAIRSWGGRTSDLDSDFIYAYRLQEPEARCDDDTCVKTIAVPYSIPDEKVQSPREAIYDVQLSLVKGGVASARVTGPELFTRMGEAVRVAAVAPTDWVGRAEAIGQAASVLALAVEPTLPAARCSAEAVSPVVLHRRCDGIELRVTAALSPGEEDRIEVEPLR